MRHGKSDTDDERNPFGTTAGWSCKSGTDGVNISLDTLNPEHYNSLTGGCHVDRNPSDGNLEAVLRGMRKAQKQAGISVKVNCVLMHQTREELLALAELAKDGVNVRFIELMPIGQGKEKHTLKEAEVKHILSETYGTIRPCEEKLGSGPDIIWKLMDLKEKLDLSVQFHINSAVDAIVSA